MATLNGTDQDDRLIGTAGADIITGFIPGTSDPNDFVRLVE